MIAKQDTVSRSRSCGILGAIGNTPLVKMERLFASVPMEFYAKLEFFNPGGSAKDRPATAMIEAALKTGKLHKGDTVVESSSGNMGIGLAQACRYYGLEFICVVDPHAQKQNLAIIRAHGGKIMMVEEAEDGDFLSARLSAVNRLVKQNRSYYWPNQYANLNNPRSHYKGTIREIDREMNGELDVLFVATSSTGTARGCRDFLREKNRHTKIVAVDAEGSILFGGKRGERKIPGLGAGVVSDLARGQQFDTVERVTDTDCVRGCRKIARLEAVLVGGSSGGIVEAVDRRRSELKGKTCAAIFHDSGQRYLDTVFNDEWVKSELGVKNPETL
ncbi:MAG: 2,3-diaminopropionate biosynthesis protein SbnA [Verrucomicrobiales bacterium]|nr:2,3-diaminopropionate biosynthesis protein SbnA [Verrucomicrobiales bacterium]